MWSLPTVAWLTWLILKLVVFVTANYEQLGLFREGIRGFSLIIAKYGDDLNCTLWREPLNLWAREKRPLSVVIRCKNHWSFNYHFNRAHSSRFAHVWRIFELLQRKSRKLHSFWVYTTNRCCYAWWRHVCLCQVVHDIPPRLPTLIEERVFKSLITIQPSRGQLSYLLYFETINKHVHCRENPKGISFWF